MFLPRMQSTPARASVRLWLWPGDTSDVHALIRGGCCYILHSRRHRASEPTSLEGLVPGYGWEIFTGPHTGPHIRSYVGSFLDVRATRGPRADVGFCGLGIM